MTELESLKKKVKAQKTELRRLNKHLQAFWRGWYHHFYVTEINDFRGKMIETFGLEEVQKAERCKKL